jgi:protein TonB
MPLELLRDVLRSGDASGRARRRLSVLPVSIAAHAFAIGLFVMMPMLTGIEMPAIASIAPSWIPTVVPTPPPPPSAPSAAAAPRRGAPTEAPNALPTEEIAPPPVSNGPGIEGGDNLGVNSGPPLLSDANVTTTPVPLPPPPPTPKVLRVGGIVREPRKLVHVPPVYPPLALQSRKEGTVTLEALLDATGKVESVRVMSSVPLLDDAAVRAVRQWRYTPTELNGVPVPVLMTIIVRFSLER